jgi:hypothetical protein
MLQLLRLCRRHYPSLIGDNIQQQHEEQQQDAGYQYRHDPTSITLTVMLQLLSCVAYIWCFSSSIPGLEHWRGAQFRDNERRI